MNIWVIIPVKTLSKTKSRLAPILSSEERASLTVKLLKRLFRVINEVDLIEKVIVVSKDERIARIANEAHHIALAEPQGADLNESIQFAFAHAEQDGATHVLILPSDLPLVTADDLMLFLSLVEEGGETAVVCSDNVQMGTNALLLPVGWSFKFQYGLNSFAKHLDEANIHRLNTCIVDVPNIQFDLDTEADWEQYQHQFGKQSQV